MYSNYCRHSLLCTKYFVCVRVCVLWIINVNQYSAMLSKETEQKANRLVKNSQIGIQTFAAYDLLLSRKDLTQISSCDPTGVCHMVLITLPFPGKNKIQELKRHLRSDPLSNDIVHVIIVLNNCHQYRLPRWTSQRRIWSDSWSEVFISVLLTCMIIIVEHNIITFVKVRLMDLTPQPKVRGELFSVLEVQNIHQTIKSSHKLLYCFS